MPLPDATRAYPAHGSGSACGNNLSTDTSPTIGEERISRYTLLDAVVRCHRMLPCGRRVSEARDWQCRDVDRSTDPEHCGAAEQNALDAIGMQDRRDTCKEQN